VTLAPTGAIALGGASKAASLALVGLSAPTGQALPSVSANGAFAPIIFTAPAMTGTGSAVTAGSIDEVSFAPVTADASGTDATARQHPLDGITQVYPLNGLDPPMPLAGQAPVYPLAGQPNTRPLAGQTQTFPLG